MSNKTEEVISLPSPPTYTDFYPSPSLALVVYKRFWNFEDEDLSGPLLLSFYLAELAVLKQQSLMRRIVLYNPIPILNTPPIIYLHQTQATELVFYNEPKEEYAIVQGLMWVDFWGGGGAVGLMNFSMSIHYRCEVTKIFIILYMEYFWKLVV